MPKYTREWMAAVYNLPQPSPIGSAGTSIYMYSAFQSEAIDVSAVCTGLHKDVNYPTHTTQLFTMTTMSLAKARSA